MEIRRISVNVKGVVQGVYFRAFTKESADEIGLSGWAKNLDDGSVQIEAQGNDSQLQNFLQMVRKGTKFSVVQSISVNDIPVTTNEQGFIIRY